jgi:hypothetical protein
MRKLRSVRLRASLQEAGRAKKRKQWEMAAVSDASIAMKEIAAINVRFALAEMMHDLDKPGVVRALDHLREAEAFLQILLIEMGDVSTEPTIAMAAG